MSELDRAQAIAVDVLKNRDPVKVKELAGAAAKAVISSPEFRDTLSAGSLVSLQAIQSAAATVLSTVDVDSIARAAQTSSEALAFTVGQQVLGIIAQQAPGWVSKALGSTGEAANKAMQDIAAAGSVFTAVLAIIWSVGDSLSKARDLQMQEYIKWMAAQREEVIGQTRDKILMAPNGSGTGGAIVPADFFAWQDWFPRYTRKMKGGKTLLMRPLVGSALIKLTESGLANCPSRPNSDVGDPGTCDPEKPLNGYVVFPPIDRAYYPIYIEGVRKAAGDSKLGIPEEWRALFQLLRISIEAQRGVKGTDGGLSLWLVYMDLLAHAFDMGWLSEAALERLLMTTITWEFNDPKNKVLGVEESTYRPSMAIPAIIELVRRWKATARPSYAQDIGAQSKQVGLISKLAKVAAYQQIGRPVPQSALEGLPADVLSDLKVTLKPSFGGLEDAVARAQSGGSPLLGVAVYGGAGLALGLLIRSARKS